MMLLFFIPFFMDVAIFFLESLLVTKDARSAVYCFDIFSFGFWVYVSIKDHSLIVRNMIIQIGLFVKSFFDLFFDDGFNLDER